MSDDGSFTTESRDLRGALFTYKMLTIRKHCIRELRTIYVVNLFHPTM
jgi:hypothetical protein